MEGLLAAVVIGLFFAVVGLLFLYPAVGSFRNFRTFSRAGAKTIDEISYDSGETAIIDGELRVRTPVTLPVDDDGNDVGAYAWELHGRSESGPRRRRNGRKKNQRQVTDYGLEYGDVVIDTGSDEIMVDFEWLQRRHDKQAAPPDSGSGWGPSKSSPFGSSTLLLEGRSHRTSVADPAELPRNLADFLGSRPTSDTDAEAKRFETRHVRDGDAVTAYGAVNVRQGAPLITASDDDRLVFSDQSATRLPRSSLKRFLRFFSMAVLLFGVAGALFSLPLLGVV